MKQACAGLLLGFHRQTTHLENHCLEVICKWVITSNFASGLLWHSERAQPNSRFTSITCIPGLLEIRTFANVFETTLWLMLCVYLTF